MIRPPGKLRKTPRESLRIDGFVRNLTQHSRQTFETDSDSESSCWRPSGWEPSSRVLPSATVTPPWTSYHRACTNDLRVRARPTGPLPGPPVTVTVPSSESGTGTGKFRVLSEDSGNQPVLIPTVPRPVTASRTAAASDGTGAAASSGPGPPPLAGHEP